MFHFQGMFSGIMKALMSGFCFVCLLVWSFLKKKLCSSLMFAPSFLSFSFYFFLSLSFFPSSSFLFFLPHFLFLRLSPQSRGVCCSLFVVWAIIQNAGLFSFWQAPEQGNEKWLTQFSSSSFSLALLLSNTCTPHTHTHTYTRVRAYVHATHPHQPLHLRLLPHALSQMISEVSSEKRHPNLWSGERFFVNVHSPWHTVRSVDSDTAESDGPCTPLISCHS